MPSRLLLFAFVALLIISACGDSETTPTGVVFGSDELPETLPESFPVPESAVVSTTLIDWDRGRTEVIFRVPADSASTVLYYDQNLPPAGYEITNRTEGQDGQSWELSFVGNDIEGTVAIGSSGTAIAQVLIIFSHG